MVLTFEKNVIFVASLYSHSKTIESLTHVCFFRTTVAKEQYSPTTMLKISCIICTLVCVPTYEVFVFKYKQKVLLILFVNV